MAGRIIVKVGFRGPIVLFGPALEGIFAVDTD